MKKRILLCTLISLLIISITGCKSNKEEVNLLSKDEMINYTKEKYGQANVINEEVKEDSIVYTLQDKEYNFNYTCTSYVYEIVIDTPTGYYDETTSCNFDKEYQNYILNKINLDNIYENSITINKAGNNVLFSVFYQDEDVAQTNIKTLTDKIKQIDTRNYFNSYYIKIYDNSNNYLGSFNINNNEYQNRYDEYVEQMTRYFAVEVNKNSGDLSGITYLYYKRLQYKDVERLQIEWLYKENVTSEDWTTAYYFDYKGKTYFMLDDIVFITDTEEIKGNHYSANYTSYWFN